MLHFANTAAATCPSFYIKALIAHSMQLLQVDFYLICALPVLSGMINLLSRAGVIGRMLHPG
jgi:hypothetical protein